MKHTILFKSLLAACFSFSTLTLAQADSTSDARAVFSNHQSSVLTIKGLMKIEVTMNGQVAQTKEVPITSQGVAVDSQLVLVAYRTIMPEVGTNAGQQPGVKIDTQLQELKLVDANGDEFDAKLVLHDETLDIAFLALDPKGDNASSYSAPAVDLSGDTKLSQLDEVVYLNRFGENLRYTAGVSLNRVVAVIDKPRTTYLCTGGRAGTSVFNTKGDFVGLTVLKKSNTGNQASPVVLPAKYAHKLLNQAREKAAAMRATN